MALCRRGYKTANIQQIPVRLNNVGPTNLMKTGKNKNRKQNQIRKAVIRAVVGNLEMSKMAQPSWVC